MKDTFHGRTRLFNEKFIATQNGDNGNDVWLVVVQSDTGEKTVIDLTKETAIDLANWILKENEK